MLKLKSAQILERWHEDMVCCNCGSTIRITENCIYKRKNLSFYAKCRCSKRINIELNKLPKLIVIKIAEQHGVLEAWKRQNHKENCGAFWHALGNP